MYCSRISTNDIFQAMRITIDNYILTLLEKWLTFKWHYFCSLGIKRFIIMFDR